MVEFEIFQNAPITEAMLDIKAKPPEGAKLSIFDKFQENIKDRFGDRKSKYALMAEFKFSPGKDETASIAPTPAVFSSDNVIGYLYRSKNENKIVQARLDGFTFNKLTPYENWKKFHSESRIMWNLYREIVNPVNIDRISLRYINRIELPLPFNDFNEYILTNPQMAPGLPQSLSHFFMRIEVPNDKIKATAIIIQTMQQPTESQKLPLIFDIDVIKVANYTRKESDMWKDFNRLRKFKNEIFFNSITEKTKELFR